MWLVDGKVLSLLMRGSLWILFPLLLFILSLSVRMGLLSQERYLSVFK
jgi:hypothetical protein